MKKEELLKFYGSYKIFIFPAVVAFCSLILIILVIYPQIIKLLGNQKDLGELMNKSSFLASKVSALESLDGEDLSKKVSYALFSYPQDKDFGYVIGLLQNISSESGFNVISISLSDSAKGGQSYSVKMELTGPASLLPILTSNIENSARLMRVVSLETSNKDINTVSVSASVDVLYSSLPKSFGSEDSPLPTLSEGDQQLLTKLAKSAPVGTTTTQTSVTNIPKGKDNPFE